MNKIYIEGGAGDKTRGSAELNIRCRMGFRKLLERCGFAGRMPVLVACGPRNDALDDFRTALQTAGQGEFVALLIDSEAPVENIEAPWAHLKRRDRWEKPVEARDDQVLLMTTCMETWIIADRETLKRHYGQKLKPAALPSLVDLESRSSHDVQTQLESATKLCSNAYAKGSRSFEVLGTLNPDVLQAHLPSFARLRVILKKRL